MSMALASRRIALELPTGLPTNGLLAHCPVVKRNLLKSSEDLTNAAWTKLGNTVSLASGSAPDGSNTAMQMLEDTSTGTHSFTQTITYSVVGATFNEIMYVKSIGGRGVRFDIFQNGTNTNIGEVITDLSTGSQGAVVGTTTVTDAGNGWWKLTISAPTTSGITAITLRVFAISSGVTTSYTGDAAKGLLIWHPQANEGMALLDYEATSDNQRVINLIPGYNAIKYSEQLDNAAWTKTRSSVSANAVANPLDGAVTADKLVEDATVSSSHFATSAQVPTDSLTLLRGKVMTLSVYAEAAGRTQFQLKLNGTVTTDTATVQFNLSTGAVLSTVAGSGTATDVGNGWYRLAVTGTVAATETTLIGICQLMSGGSTSFSGDGASGVYLWGAMLNEGSTALPYERTMDIAATKDPQYGWAYHLQLGSSSASDTNDPVYLTNLLDPDAVDDYVMIPLHLVDRDEWTIIAAVKSKSGMAFNPRAFGVRYDGSASKFVATTWDATNTRGLASYANGGGTANPNIGATASWATDTWGLLALSFNRSTGALTARQIVVGALATVTATNTGLSTPDVARLLNSPIATGFPMDGGGAYALIYNRALSDAEIMRAYKYMQQAKRETVTL